MLSISPRIAGLRPRLGSGIQCNQEQGAGGSADEQAYGQGQLQDADENSGMRNLPEMTRRRASRSKGECTGSSLVEKQIDQPSMGRSGKARRAAISISPRLTGATTDKTS